MSRGGGRLRITVRNARFQQWAALRDNRTRRQRAGEFLVQGVRPISQAISHGWPVRALIHRDDVTLSRWAEQTLDSVDTTVVAMAAGMVAELGGRDEPPELVAVVAMPADDLQRIPATSGRPVVVLDRPGNPGNVGTVVRSADAFGAAGVVVTGHAADLYDPQAVRASTGSLFAVPAVRVPSHRQVLAWVHDLRRRGLHLPVIGTDESGERDAAGSDLAGGCLLVIGNETAGLSAAWRDSCDAMVRIPIAGSASSLNAAVAASILLYEWARQRGM